MDFKNLANTLTLARIGLIPFILISFFINLPTPRLVAACLFTAACITDYLDGFIARAFNQETRFGEILDPIADKLLIASTLLMLVGFDHISKFSIFAAVIILCREILVSGLREYLAETNILLPVNWITKMKTAIQMCALAILLYVDPQGTASLKILGELLLWIAAGITLYSGWTYVKTSIEATSDNSFN
ncbi:MAG: CDP-diacylglycerol--glycerol-3-phosphate 3-phosphatidyltransferase [Pseudomonadota bacterium]|nr:CDP-diacylglycerol--glycerol-3-phosphate 3-phosphatidyltransferase [Alphaproteobacteria bacterium]